LILFSLKICYFFSIEKNRQAIPTGYGGIKKFFWLILFDAFASSQPSIPIAPQESTCFPQVALDNRDIKF